MFKKIKELWSEFDKEVLEKGHQAEKVKVNPEVKEEYQKSEYDFRGNK